MAWIIILSVLLGVNLIIIRKQWKLNKVITITNVIAVIMLMVALVLRVI